MKSEIATMIQGSAAQTAGLAGTPITAISEGTYVLGVLRHEDQRRVVVLVNHDTAFTTWPTVQFDVPDAAVQEVDRASGEIVAVLDDSPDVSGLQLSLDAGDARLFIIPAQAAAPAPLP